MVTKAEQNPVLFLDHCIKQFGGLVATNDLTMKLNQGDLYGLIGPNGAGKTTIFNLITGVYPTDSGKISFEGKVINGLKPHQIAESGISRTFQNIRLFGNLDVLENVLIGAHMHRKQTIWGSLVRNHLFYKEEAEMEHEAMKLLKMFNLHELSHEKARNLPYGSQRRLEIVRALFTRPRLLLLDEPAAGMNPQESMELMELIRRLRDEFQLTILLVEHNMKVVMGVCEVIQVIDHGESIAFGSPDEIRSHPKVIEAYLGAH